MTAHQNRLGVEGGKLQLLRVERLDQDRLDLAALLRVVVIAGHVDKTVNELPVHILAYE